MISGVVFTVIGIVAALVWQIANSDSYMNAVDLTHWVEIEMLAIVLLVVIVILQMIFSKK